jgi:hypothetical protein
MNVVRLDNSTFLPDYLIDGYDSMIWTERYREAGEFELKTFEVERILDLLPVDGPSLISHLATDEVMIVENHEITVDDEGTRILTVTGRSFETFLEQRVIPGMTDIVYTSIKQYNTQGCAELVAWNAVVNASTHDVIIVTDHNEEDAVPNVAISESTDVTTTTRDWFFEPMYSYERLMEILTRNNLGVRCIRPPIASAKIVTFDTDDVNRGTIHRTITSNVTDLCIDIYNGHNRTADVIFTVDQGHIENPEYLFSIKNNKTVGHVASSVEWGPLYSDRETTWSGLARRILLLNFGNKFGSITENVHNIIMDKLESAVKKTRKTIFLDGEINSTAPYRYGDDYFLGDTVTVLAEYGIQKSVKVTEYIWTEDASGNREYPTLAFDGDTA